MTMTTTQQLEAAADAYIRKAKPASNGTRNNQAFNLSGHLRRFITEPGGEQLSQSQILSLMTNWNDRNSDPLSETELKSAVHSGYADNGTPRKPHVVKLNSAPYRKSATPPAGTDAPGQKSQAERDAENWHIMTASELGPGDQIEWTVYGVLALGYITLLTGLWKSGKTTFLSWLIRALDAGDDFLGPVKQCKVLIVSEEGKGLWSRRRDALEFTDNVSFLCRPFRGRPIREQWEAFILHLVAYAKEHGISVVIIDTISSMWPCDNENDASKVMAALSTLHHLTEAGIGVLLTHHPRKGDGGEAQASRGSGALPGYVDTIIELRRFEPENRKDCRRTLTGYGRFEETPSELVIELTGEGYRAIGSKKDAGAEQRLRIIAGILGDQPAGTMLTVEGVRENWPEGVVRPGKRTVGYDLADGWKKCDWIRQGKGVAGDPHVFFLAPKLRLVGPAETDGAADE